MNTSTLSPFGVGGASRYLSFHTVAIRKNELINPYVSATIRMIEKTSALWLSDEPHRQLIQYRPYSQAITAKTRVINSSPRGRLGMASRNAVSGISALSRGVTAATGSTGC